MRTQVKVVTREPKPPLFAVYVMQHAAEVLRAQQQRSGVDAASVQQQVASGQLLGDGADELLVVQHADGAHSDAWHAVRAAMGLPPLRV